MKFCVSVLSSVSSKQYPVGHRSEDVWETGNVNREVDWQQKALTDINKEYRISYCNVVDKTP